MKNLIAIQQANIDGTPTNAVDARELHAILEVKKAFTTWIKTNLDAIGAEEHKDYMKLKTSLEGSGYKNMYIVTTDIAKHISMMSKTEKGKEVRSYFIKMEEVALSKALMSPNQITEALALTAQSLTLQDERLDTHNERLINLEQNARLSNQQEYELTQTHHKKVYELAKQYGKDSEDKALIRKLHQRVWSIFKKHFMLPRFNELKSCDFQDGLAFINNLSLKDMT